MIDFLIYSGYVLLLLNLILYCISFFREEKTTVLFVWYLAFSFIMQFLMELCYHLKVSNLTLINIFFIGQLILLGFFYRNLMITEQQKNFVKWGIGLGFLAVGIHYFLDPSQFFKFNLFEIAVTSLLIVAFAVLHLYNMLTEKKEFYYVTIGMIIYLLSSTVLFFVGNLTIVLSTELKFLPWTLNAFLFVVYQLFILFEWKKSFYKKGIFN